MQTIRKAYEWLKYRILDGFHSASSESKSRWNELAGRNAKYFIYSDEGEAVSDAQFRESGKRDVDQLLVADPVLKPALTDANTLLEIGCGNGRMTEFVASLVQRVVAVDIADEMIRQGKERLAHIGNIEWHAGDGKTLPAKDASVDAVFSYIVFQHMPSHGMVESNVREVARVLKPGGIAKIQFRGIPSAFGKWFSGISYTHAELTALIQSVPGMSVVKMDGEGNKYFWAWMQKSAD